MLKEFNDFERRPDLLEKFDEVVQSDDSDQETIDAVRQVREVLSTVTMQTAKSSGEGGEDCVFITARVPLTSLALILNL